jgi:hypothetical protein
VEGKGIKQIGMDEAPEHGKDSAHANGMNE